MFKHLFELLINGYGRSADSASRRSFVALRLSGSTAKGKRGGFLNVILRIAERLSSTISYTYSKVYGASLLTFGVLSIIIHFVKEYFSIPIDRPGISLAIGIATSLLAIPALLSDKTMVEALQSNPVTDYIIFEFFCIKRVHRLDYQSTVPLFLLVSLSVLLAAAEFFFPVWAIFLAVCVVAFVYLAFLSPEFSFLVTVLLLPYLSYIPSSTLVFSFAVLVTVASLIRKIVYGKRVVFFEQYDVYIGLMMAVILLSGIFIKGFESFYAALFLVIMSAGYFLASNLLSNRRLLDCMHTAVCVSSVPASIYSVYILISRLCDGTASELTGYGISSVFPTTGSLAVFMLVSAITALAMIKQRKRWGRVAFLIIFVLNMAAITLSGEFLAFGALLLGFGVYLSLRVRYLSAAVIVFAFAAPYAVLILPEWMIDPILTYVPGLNSLDELHFLWSNAFAVMQDNLLLGVGIGTECFVAEMEAINIFGYTDSNNLFIELGVEAGIFALALFLIVLLIRLRHRAEYFSYMKNSSVEKQAPFIAVATFSLLVMGSMEYIWSYLPSFYLFWCIFGVGSASLRVARRETDDRILYYEDTRTSDYSAIDVEIR